MKIKTAAAFGFMAAGLGSLVAAGYEGLHYSAWADPRALDYMVRYAGLALVFLAVPAAMLVIWFTRQFIHEMARTGLTPTQVAVAEAAVMAYAHHEWSRRNAEDSARLTESVMGPERTGEWPSLP
jgi:hypothetical protein